MIVGSGDENAAKKDLDGIAHEQTIICRHLFAGHVVGSQPMKMGGGEIYRMIINNYSPKWRWLDKR